MIMLPNRLTLRFGIPIKCHLNSVSKQKSFTWLGCFVRDDDGEYEDDQEKTFSIELQFSCFHLKLDFVSNNNSKLYVNGVRK